MSTRYTADGVHPRVSAYERWRSDYREPNRPQPPIETLADLVCVGAGIDKAKFERESAFTLMNSALDRLEQALLDDK